MVMPPRSEPARSTPPPQVERVEPNAVEPPAAPSSRTTVSALAVPSFADAVVVSPDHQPAPVIVVLHGNGDSPDWICPAFSALVNGRAFIVCPRGVPFDGRDDLFTYPSNRARVAAEVRAALEAIAQREGDRVDLRAPVLAGFSLGAMFASFLAADDPDAFPRALVIDTHHVWSRRELASYDERGGDAVAFVCTRGYVRDCERLCSPSGTGTVDDMARCRTLPDREHGYDDALFDLVRPDFEALVGADTRWRSAPE